MEANKPTRTQRSKQEVFQLMEEFESSGAVTIAEFCEMNEISNATFHNWQKRYRSRNENPSGFVSMKVTAFSAMEAGKPALFAEVTGIRLYRSVSASYLKELANE